MSNHLYMQRALELARLGIGRTRPNPMVGCVIVFKGRIIGEGWPELGRRLAECKSPGGEIW